MQVSTVGIAGNLHTVNALRTLDLTNPEEVAAFAKMVRELGVQLVVWDVLARMHSADENDKPPVYTYGITTIRFEPDPDTGKWVWFDGERNQSPRKTQDGWRLGSKRLHDTREGAEAELQREMVKNGDRVTKVHDLPDDMPALKKIRSAHHPDRNPDADGDLYQAVVEKLDRMRTATQ
ncbi:MAG: hypothetical protein LT080_06445 [Thiobacillus sp.]|nr:hypothetical protein [Thiobacillus sp.]